MENEKCKFIVPTFCEWQMCTDPSACPFIDKHGNCNRPKDVKQCPIEDENAVHQAKRSTEV